MDLSELAPDGDVPSPERPHTMVSLGFVIKVSFPALLSDQPDEEQGGPA